MLRTDDNLSVQNVILEDKKDSSAQLGQFEHAGISAVVNSLLQKHIL